MAMRGMAGMAEVDWLLDEAIEDFSSWATRRGTLRIEEHRWQNWNWRYKTCRRRQNC